MNFIAMLMNKVNLLDFDFAGIELAQFDIEGAYINSAVLLAQGLYDSSFYERAIAENKDWCTLMLSAPNEAEEANEVIHHDVSSDTSLADKLNRFYYISDMHLNHKLLARFGEHASEPEVEMYIITAVKKLLDTVPKTDKYDYLFIAGDISFQLEISRLFYSELARRWKGQIIVVLGNHELWTFQNGCDSTHESRIKDVVEQYRAMLNELGICLLQNELLLLYQSSSPKLLTEEQLLKMPDDRLQGLCLTASVCVLGGVGFSGYNPQFNATQGIYRNTLMTLEEDITETKRFEALYQKVKSAIPQEKVIVLTHMPKENWSKDEYNATWIYVNGHTHRNLCSVDDRKTVYADNQIGYRNSSFGLKCFALSPFVDVFRHYGDGKYEIDNERYIGFYRELGESVTFNRRDGTIHMLKRDGIYCFLWQEYGTLYLLSGGSIRTVPSTLLDYYYERMSYYADIVKAMLSSYHVALKNISELVKAIGGSGKIHGSIIDIDFINHIFLDPLTGAITAYCAASVTNRHEYSDISALLKNHRKDLYDNYCKVLQGSDRCSLLPMIDVDVNTELARLVMDTTMYKPSGVMKSLQYLTEKHIIRNWNDDVFERMAGFVEERAATMKAIEE